MILKALENSELAARILGPDIVEGVVAKTGSSGPTPEG
jgi:hypothetical protein